MQSFEWGVKGNKGIVLNKVCPTTLNLAPVCVSVHMCVSPLCRRVESCVKARVAGYPGRAQQQLQRTTAWLPRRLGLLLQADPQLVSAAVAAFMTR